MLRVVQLSGSPKAMGEAFGEQLRAEIQEFYRLRVLNALKQAKQFGGRALGEAHLLAVSDKGLSISEAYDPEGYAELVAIGRAANLSAAQIFAMNGLTDLRDVLAWSREVPGYEEGCSSAIVMGDRTQSGQLLGGQTWDLATDNMPYVIGVHRRPLGAPETWSLTTVGCLTLIGMNAEGIAVGTTNIRTKDARPGIGYLSILHKALGTRSLEAASDCVTTRHRAAAHYYWILSGKERRARGIECTATLHHVHEPTRGHYVHCNHVLVDEHRALEGQKPAPTESTVCRQSRMDTLLGSVERVDAQALRGFLADHEGGEGAICRHDYAGISSNGAVVIEPERLAISACQGLPCTEPWVDLIGA